MTQSVHSEAALPLSAAAAARTVQGHRHGRVPRAYREQQLLDVAEDQFARFGYQGASIDGIADAASVTRPMVYNYFSSKDGIYLACLRRARGRLEAEMIQAVGTETEPRARLARGFDAYFSFLEKNLGSWQVLFGGGAASAGPAAEEARNLRFATVRRIAEMVSANLGPNKNPQEVEAFAHMASGAGEQLAKWWRMNPTMTRQQLTALQLSMLWPGLEQLLARSVVTTAGGACEPNELPRARTC